MQMRSAQRNLLPVLTALAVLLSLLETAAGTARALPSVDGPTTTDDVNAYLDDPGRVAEGQVAAHTRLWPFADDRSATAGSADASPYVRSLAGDWKLELVDKPGDVPAGFQADGFDSSSWRTVQVPHTWQSDFLDHPMFRNVPMEVWPDDPPTTPKDVNPTGAYLKTFEVPQSWDGRRQLIRFEGVTSAYFVWVNGRYVGYDQGGYSPAEFDVTDVVRPGVNTLAVQVHRWSSGSYLEDVDQWRYSGIFRDVYAYSVPPARISDAYITTDLDASYRDAVLAVDTELTRDGAPAGRYGLTATLLDPAGKQAGRLTGTADLSGETADAKLTGTVPNPAKWSDETPTLYTLLLALTAPDGSVVHRTSQRIGFREIEVRDKQILLNGKRVLFRGVNRAETDPDTGRHVSREAMERDVALMKSLNVNAVRTSHYESDPYWYELADRHGLLIADEVDIETHSHENCPSCPASWPEWADAFHDRFSALVERDKNHPSVVIWDTGNEAGLGTAHFTMAEYADAHEPTRLLYHQANSPNGDAPYADVFGPRYPTPGRLESMAKSSDRPIVMGEYAHAQGNGLGNFDQFWALARKYPKMQGGFIWDWAEANLSQPLVGTPDSSAEKVQTFFVGKPELGEGHQGKGVVLSSLDDFVNTFRDPALDVTGGLTLDAWVKPASWTGSFPILTKGQQYALQMPNASTLELRVTVGGQQKVVRAPVPANWSGSWHRVTGTYDGTSLALYVDGALAGTLAAPGRIEPGLWEVNVGRNAQTQQSETVERLAHGTFDQVRILNRALSAAEVAAGNDQVADAVLALDFESATATGEFNSVGVSMSGTDGLVDTDRNPQPETAEMAWAQSPLRISSTDPAAGKVVLRNEQQHAGLDLRVRWAVREAGRTVTEGVAPVRLAPGATTTLTLPVAADNPRSLERFLDVDAETVRDLGPGRPAGWVVQRDQFRVGGTQVTGVGTTPAAGAVSVVGTAGTVVVSGKDFAYTLDRAAGTLTSMKAGGAELLRRGPELSVIRPPTSNEFFPWGIADRERWNAIGMDRMRTSVRGVDVSRLPDGRARLTVTSVVAAPGHEAELSFDQTMTYTVDASGAIELGHDVQPKGTRLGSLPYLPRVGFTLQVPDRLARFAYYGRGPGESYNDRASGNRIGVHRSTVDEQYVRYSRPQAYGNHTDTRWASLNDRRSGVLVAAGKGADLDVSVTPYDDLQRAEYDFQLPQVRNAGWVTLNVNHLETGMGETPNQVLAPYYIEPGKRRTYAVTLRPLAATEVTDGAPQVIGPPACEPSAAVRPQGAAKQGTPQRVDVVVSGECAQPVTGISARLAAPDGWTVSPATVALDPVAAGESRTASFTVTPPADAPTGSYDLTGTVGFTLAGGPGEVTAAAAVTLPLLPGQHWASDLAFAGTPANGWGPVERDTSNGENAAGDGGPLRIGGTTYAKGFGAHAVSSIPLTLPAGCTRFSSDVGVDDEVGGGSVGFEVWAGDQRLAVSPRLTGADAAHRLDVALNGQSELRLVVTDGGNGVGEDHGDWAGALLTCTP